MVTPPHTPVPFSPVLEDAYVPTPEKIADAVREVAGATAAGAHERVDPEAGDAQVGPVDDGGPLVAWLVDEGAEVAVGDEVAEVETEKINGRVEATGGGVLRRRVAAEGDVIPVGGLLGGDRRRERPRRRRSTPSSPSSQATFVPGEAEEEAGPRRRRCRSARARCASCGRARAASRSCCCTASAAISTTGCSTRTPLSAGRAVYALDLPGHGGSTKEVGDGTLDVLVEALRGSSTARGSSARTSSGTRWAGWSPRRSRSRIPAACGR